MKKNKIKRKIFVGTTSIIVVTVCGVVGWKVIKSNNSEFQGEVVEQSFLTAQDIKGVYSDQTINDVTYEQIQTYLSKVGFGYNLTNVAGFDYTEEQIKNADPQDYMNPADQLYMAWNSDVTEKPEYGGDEEPEIHSVFGDGTVYAYYEFKGEEILSQTYTYDVQAGETWEDKMVIAESELKEGFDRDYAIWEKWNEYVTKRNEWFFDISSKGFLKERDSFDIEDAEYRNFWVNMAQRIMGLTEGTDEQSLQSLLKILTDLCYDEDGNEREDIPNLLAYKTSGMIDQVPDYAKEIIIAAGGSLDGSTGSGGSSSGSGSGTPSGGDPSGGTNSGSSGDSSSNGDSSSKGDSSEETTSTEDDYEKAGDEKDTVAAKFKDVSLTYPTVAASYSKGQKIQIKVNFDKNIYGTIEGTKVDKDSAPKLLIRFSENNTKNKEMSFESSGGSSIIYTYIIQEEDNGTVLLADGDNFDGVLYNGSGVPTIIKKIENLTDADKIIIDNKAPEIKTVEVTSEKGNYEVGKEVKVKITFNEAVYTAKNKIPITSITAPVFMASFGLGQAKKFTFEAYSEQEKSITYKYVITAEDKGKLKIDVNNIFDGTKEIYDASGNGAKLTKGVDLTGNEIIANPTEPRIELDKEAVTVDLKDKEEGKDLTITLNATLEGDFSDGAKVTWMTGDLDVATVNSSGVVTIKSVGQALILARVYKDNEIEAEAKCTITVKDTTKGETKVQLSNVKENIIEIDKNGTNQVQLEGEAVKVDENGNVVEKTEQKITYVSKDESIAKIEDGKVIGVTPGETTIIAKSEDGAETEFKVVITNSSKTEPTSINTELISVTVDSTKTKEFEINYEVLPKESSENAGVTFTSSDENVATVDKNGKVTIKGEGSAVIVLTTANGKKAYTLVKSMSEEESQILKNILSGDYNEDQKVDMADLLVMLRHVAASKNTETAEKHQGWLILDDKYYIIDINKDALVDTADILKMQRHMAATNSETIASQHEDWILSTDTN